MSLVLVSLKHTSADFFQQNTLNRQASAFVDSISSIQTDLVDQVLN